MKAIIPDLNILQATALFCEWRFSLFLQLYLLLPLTAAYRSEDFVEIRFIPVEIARCAPEKEKGKTHRVTNVRAVTTCSTRVCLARVHASGVCRACVDCIKFDD